MIVQHLQAFPVDYVLMAGIILYFFFCSMGGLQHIGIWCCWIRVSFSVLMAFLNRYSFLFGQKKSFSERTLTSFDLFSDVQDTTTKHEAAGASFPVLHSHVHRLGPECHHLPNYTTVLHIWNTTLHSKWHALSFVNVLYLCARYWLLAKVFCGIR